MSAPSSSGVGVVIVGAGQAGSEVATSLRQQGYVGAITIVGDEGYLPYRRPPLSKGFLSGEDTLDSLLIRNDAMYAKLGIACRLGNAVVSIDRDARSVELQGGEKLHYAKLVLATGGYPRQMTLPGAEHSNIHYVRSIPNILSLQQAFRPGQRLVVVGGGYIGLEAAAVGIKKGLVVTVLEAMPRVLARVAAPEISAFYEQAHRRRGVDVRTAVTIQSLEGQDRIDAVLLSDGSRIAADLLIVGIGLVPGTALAERAGLAVDNGIVVDRYARTSDPDILAAGDCANHENEFLGRSIRLESVPSALEQARVAASTIAGKSLSSAAVPWFWSDQYDLKLQMVGLSQGYDEFVLRGDPATESFSAYYLKDGVVISADAVNRPQDFALAKRLVAGRVRASAELLADEAVALKNLLG